MIQVDFKGRFGGVPTGKPGSERTPDPRTLPAAVRRSKSRQEILASVENLPAMPHVVAKVLAVSADPNSSARDFEDLVRGDQVLVARLLRLANSSFYRRAEPVANITRAVVALGFRTLRSLVTAVSTSRLLSRPIPAYGYADKGLWAHSVAVACLARAAGRFLGDDDDELERLFTAGLLHDIGKVVLAPFVAALDLDRRPGTAELLEIEKERLGISHPEAGGLVLQKWRLPETTRLVVEGHHDPARILAERAIATVHLANRFARSRRIGLADPAPDPAPVDVAVGATLALDQARWRALEVALEAAIGETEALQNA